MATSPRQHDSCIFIFDSPRTRSHLFFRYLSTSPNVYPIYHPYILAAMVGPESIMVQEKQADLDVNSDEDAKHRDRTFAASTKDSIAELAAAKTAGKIPLADEHWYAPIKPEVLRSLKAGEITVPKSLGDNPARMPDSILNDLTPVFLIRHPVNVLGGILRTERNIGLPRLHSEDLVLFVRNEPLRILFDYFRTEKNKQPLVVDGDDILWRTSAVSQKLCLRLGLDELEETWPPTSQEVIDQMHPEQYHFTKDFHDSNGIVRPPGGEPPKPDVDRAIQQWTESYGGDIAARLRELVEMNMPNYEYLSQFKL